ncbi:MAG TPA: iron-sulfur cluster assembly accessory protein [Candidatus Megaira endosymbiont of Nemacystus decipiens]|nr:iron-sulfur cluster assembly accessory protein [Candidatus Megaera endosymbiont of Nemacystus decipiens]
MPQKAVMSLTDAAVNQIQLLLKQREKPAAGIRIGVKSGGCSGLKYYVEYADQKNQFDEVIEYKGLTIFIDPKALMYLLGTEMDYIEEEFKSGFTFTNPNEKAKCGCGSSFNV